MFLFSTAPGGVASVKIPLLAQPTRNVRIRLTNVTQEIEDVLDLWATSPTTLPTLSTSTVDSNRTPLVRLLPLLPTSPHHHPPSTSYSSSPVMLLQVWHFPFLRMQADPRNILPSCLHIDLSQGSQPRTCSERQLSSLQHAFIHCHSLPVISNLTRLGQRGYVGQDASGTLRI